MQALYGKRGGKHLLCEPGADQFRQRVASGTRDEDAAVFGSDLDLCFHSAQESEESLGLTRLVAHIIAPDDGFEASSTTTAFTVVDPTSTPTLYFTLRSIADSIFPYLSEGVKESGTFRISSFPQLNRTDQPAVDLFYSAEESWKFGMSPILSQLVSSPGDQEPEVGGQDIVTKDTLAKSSIRVPSNAGNKRAAHQSFLTSDPRPLIPIPNPDKPEPIG